MKRFPTALLLPLCLFAGMAIAAEPDPPTTGTTPKADRSGHAHGEHHGPDDKTERKAPDGKSREFVALDTDRNGTLSRKELRKHALAPHFDMLDIDRNGALSPTEFAAGKGM